MRIVIVGGGIIGLCCARSLAATGAAVTVVDGAPGAREASWAAAGMLAPHHEADADSPLWRLCAAGLERWPGLLADLGCSPQDVDWQDGGGWIRGRDGDELDRLEAQLRWLRATGTDVLRLSPAAFARTCPAVDPGAGALWLPGAQVDPRPVLERLQAVCAAAGVVLRYGARVDALADGVVRLADGGLPADEVVLASGAWTTTLARLAGLDLPGGPVKGQLVRLQTGIALPGFVRHGHHYLLSRAGRGVVVGATMVEAGFDRSDDPAAIAGLAAWAAEVVPGLRGAAVAEAWTGLRPRLASGMPVIGRVRPGLIVATGHFRNGILLAPITGELVADAATGRTLAFDAFQPGT